MAEYLGSLGALVQLGVTSSESTSRPDRYLLQESSAGGVRAQIRPLAPRAWGIAASMFTDRELAALEGFVLGEWGNGPWQWVSIAAQNGNLLTPAESLCLAADPSGLPAGPMECADGTWAGRSLAPTYAGSGWGVLWDSIPVIPGKPVTFSADVSGDGVNAPQIAAGFYTVAGSQVGGAAYSVAGAAGGTQRVTVSAVAPEGAAEVRVGARASVSRLARPQVTWGTAPVPWTTGKGCRKAVPLGVNSDLRLSSGRGPSFSDVQVTIQELT